MLLEEMLRDANAKGRHKGRLKGRREGRREGIREGKIGFIIQALLSKGYVTPELKQKITEQITNDNIDSMFSKALQAKTIEDFEKELY